MEEKEDHYLDAIKDINDEIGILDSRKSYEMRWYKTIDIVL